MQNRGGSADDAMRDAVEAQERGALHSSSRRSSQRTMAARRRYAAPHPRRLILHLASRMTNRNHTRYD